MYTPTSVFQLPALKIVNYQEQHVITTTTITILIVIVVIVISNI